MARPSQAASQCTLLGSLSLNHTVPDKVQLLPVLLPVSPGPAPETEHLPTTGLVLNKSPRLSNQSEQSKYQRYAPSVLAETENVLFEPVRVQLRYKRSV